MIKMYVNLSNLAGAVFLQAGNFLVPVALLPILISSLGISGYGTFSYVYAIIQYFILLTDWGFILSATRQISLQRQDRKLISRIFWTTVFARTFLCALCYLSLEVGCLFFGVSPNIYRWAFLVVCASAISPVFFYQGLEELGKISLISSVIKILSIPMVWLTVKNLDDLILAIAIYGIFTFLASLIILFYLLKSRKIDAPVFGEIDIFSSLKDSWPLFLSTASVSLYTNSNLVILGLMVNSAAVGIFSGAITIIRVFQGVYQPAAQVFFPKISHAFSKGLQSGADIFRFIFFWQGLFTFFASIFLYTFGPKIMLLMTGSESTISDSIIRLMSPLIFLTGLSNIFGIQGMVSLGYNLEFKRILLMSGILNIILTIPLSYYLEVQGTALSTLITELVITIAMGLFLYRRQPVLFKVHF